MPSFEEVRIIPCPRARLFDVVMDIEAYPRFLPWVAEARILQREDCELVAELVAEFAGLRHAFRTVDRFLPYKMIEIRLLEGPFRFLESLWTFEALSEETTNVRFSIEFEFSNPWLGMVAGPVFSTACRTMVHAFEARALAVAEGGGA